MLKLYMEITNFIEKQFKIIETKYQNGSEEISSLNSMLSVLMQIVDDHDLYEEYSSQYLLLKEKINFTKVR